MKEKKHLVAFKQIKQGSKSFRSYFCSRIESIESRQQQYRKQRNNQLVVRNAAVHTFVVIDREVRRRQQMGCQTPSNMLRNNST